MKRRAIIASFAFGTAGITMLASTDRLSAMIDALPLQSAEPEFSLPPAHRALEAPYAAGGGDAAIAVATATPFANGANAGGAVDALEAVAARNPGISFDDAIAPEAAGISDDLTVLVASFDAKDAAHRDTGAKPLATKLFDDDESWRSRIYADNPLVGSILRPDGSSSDPDSLLDAVKGARYVLLGEIHDNPDHHRLQAGIIHDAAEAGKTPAVVMEMIPETFSDILAGIDANGGGDLTALARKLQWAERGWPDFSIYAPVFSAALDNGLPIVAGNVDAETVRRIVSGETQGLTAEERARFGLDLPMDPEASEDLAAELKASHCNLLPEAAIGPMETAQRTRDGAMAAAMIDSAETNGSAILIAGSGHVREDRGVPSVIAGLTGDNDAVSVQMVEISDETADEAADYGMTRETPVAYDFTIFTPRTDLTDHCAEMRRMAGSRGGGEAPASE